MKFDDELEDLIWTISLALNEYLYYEMERPLGTTVPLTAETPLLNEVAL